MNLLDFVSDTYEREARLIPAIFVALPLLILCLLLAPALRTEFSWLIALLAGGGGFALVQSVIRDRGKAIETDLWVEWGGMPSVARLRYRDAEFSETETRSFHTKAAALIKGLAVPTPGAEASDPSGADAIYRQISSWILANTRSVQKYPLVTKHNIGYGFRRNLLGGKPLAIGLDIFLFVFAIGWALLSAGLWQRQINISNLGWQHWAALISPVLHASIYCLIVTKAWVKRAADAFAIQLIGSLHSMK